MNINTNQLFSREAFLPALVALGLVAAGLVIAFFPKGNPATEPNGTKPGLAPALASSPALVELKLKWRPGQHQVVDFEVKQNTPYRLRDRSGTVNGDFTLGNQIGRTVLWETADGGHELELEILSARTGIQLGDHTVLDYHSTTPPAANPTNEVAAVFGQIVGSKIHYFLNASNNAERLEGVDELVGRIQSVPQTEPYTSDIKKVFGAEYFHMLTNASPLLPHQAVQPGDAWTAHAEYPTTRVGVQVWDYKVLFQNWETHGNHHCARLEFQGIMKVKSDPHSKRDETTYQPRDGVSEGVVWFDPELGQMIETDMKNDVNIDKQTSLNPSGTPGAAGPRQTITSQEHQIYTIKLEP